MNRIKFALFITGVAAFAGLAIYAGMDAVGGALSALHWSGLGIITALHIPIIIMLGIAWWWIGRQGRGGGLAKFITARFVRDSVSEVLPFSQIGGFLSGVRVLGLDQGNVWYGASSMFVDMVVEFVAKLFYVLSGLLSLLYLLPRTRLTGPLSAALLLVVGGIALAANFRKEMRAMIWRLATRLLQRWTHVRSDGMKREDFDRLFSRRRVWPSFAIHAACWFFGTAEAWVTLRLMGVTATGLEALVIDSLASSLRMIGFMVPAAVGVQEAGYVLVCVLLGIPPPEAIALSLARRARDLALGLPGLAVWQFLEGRTYRLGSAGAHGNEHLP